MVEHRKEIENRMIHLNNETLLRIINEEREDYEPIALEIAEDILKQRRVNFGATSDIEHEVTEVITKENESLPVYEELYKSAGGYETIYSYKDEFIEKSKVEEDTIRPWVRYWARTIDLFIWGVLLRETIKLASISTYKFLISEFYSLLLSLLIYITWLYIETLLISRLGYTFGKWLLKVKVRDQNNKKLSFSQSAKRAFSVWLYGEGLNLPYINAIANIFAYSSLMKIGRTKWDSKLNIKVSHSRIGWRRSIVAIIILSLPSIMVIINRFN